MINEINTKEARVYIDGGAIVLDVRTKEEYEGERIKESMNVDIHSPSFMEQIENLDKERSYVVYCASGARSLSAVNMMLELGFSDAHSLAGGIAGWKKDGMGVEE